MLLQPLQPSLVGQMLDLEVLELSLEALAVGTCCHHAHHDGGIVLHPAVAHHRVFFVIEGILVVASSIAAIDTNNFFIS